MLSLPQRGVISLVLYRLPILIFAMGIVYVFIVPPEPFILNMLFKLIPILMIIIYSLRKLPHKKSAIHWLIPVGLVFGMIGNATSHQWGIGVLSFLIGHILYTTGFLTKWTYSRKRLIMTLPFIIYGLWFGNLLLHNLYLNESNLFTLTILLYLVVLIVMALVATMTGNTWAILASLLWVIASSMAIWDTCITSIDYVEPIVVFIYYSAQFFLAHSLESFNRKNKMLIW